MTAFLKLNADSGRRMFERQSRVLTQGRKGAKARDRFEKPWHVRGEASRAFYSPKNIWQDVALWFRGWRIWRPASGDGRRSKKCRQLGGIAP